MPTRKSLANSRKRKLNASPPREPLSEDDSSKMAAGSVSTDSREEAAPDRQKNLQRSQGFQIYTGPISREPHRGTINQCTPVPPRPVIAGSQSKTGANKARKTFPPAYHKSRIIPDALRNGILEQATGSQGKKETNAKPTNPAKQDLLVLSTTGTYWDKTETVTQQKASKIQQANTPSSSQLNKKQPKAQTQVLENKLIAEPNQPTKVMPRLIPITKDMVFLPL